MLKKDKKPLKDGFLRHPVLVWAIISALFAALIHIAFSFPAINDFFIAKWGAGELLAYSSTVAIGLLAFWQNKRFKQENDIVQEQLQRIIKEANTITIVNRIIEIENNNLFRLCSALDSFSAACDPIEISTNFANSQSNGENTLAAISAMASQEKHIDDSFFSLSRELRLDQRDFFHPSDSFVTAFCACYEAAKNVVKKLRDDPISSDKDCAENLRNSMLRFISERERLLRRRKQILNKTIYGNLSIEEIKKLYYEEYLIQEASTNGQTENAQPE